MGSRGCYIEFGEGLACTIDCLTKQKRRVVNVLVPAEFLGVENLVKCIWLDPLVNRVVTIE